MVKTVPYTYFIKHKITGQKYYGVKYAKGCHPKQFFVNYFTSSKIIHNIIEQHGKDIFEYRIHKVFNTPEEAAAYEIKMLKRLNATSKSDWFNQSISGSLPVQYSIGIIPWNKGLKNTNCIGRSFYNNGKVQKMFYEDKVPTGWVKGRLNNPWNKGLNVNDERVRKNAVASGLANKNKIPWNKGKTKESDERLEKLSLTIKANMKLIKCPHCDVTGLDIAMNRWHFDNCQLNKDKPKKK